jgi:hypothetical protein
MGDLVQGISGLLLEELTSGAKCGWVDCARALLDILEERRGTKKRPLIVHPTLLL